MKSSKQVKVATRYGGLIPVLKEMIRLKLPELINDSLNSYAPRAKQSKYQYSDMLLTWILGSFCGVQRIDQITRKKKHLACLNGFKVPSHDNIGYQMKKLVAEIHTEERKMNYQVNKNFYDENIVLNQLLINATKLMGGLSETEEYVLDVDCTFINTRCVGARSAKNVDKYGFYPMICLIGNYPVFVSMRNGNSSADFRISETIEQCLNMLGEAGIKVKTVRTDGAGYRLQYLSMTDNKGINFVTASPVNPTYKAMLSQLDQTTWRNVEIETANSFKECQIAEIPYKMHMGTSDYRVIALRIPKDAKFLEEMDSDELENFLEVQNRMKVLEKNRKLKSKNRRYQEGTWNTLGDYKYKMITSNDWETPAEELAQFYNHRGTRERDFSFMKRDFGWKFPPFAKMNENTVFMIIAALANNVFRSIVKLLDGKISGITEKTRVTIFQTLFIDVIAFVVKKEWEFYDSPIDYSKIS